MPGKYTSHEYTGQVFLSMVKHIKKIATWLLATSQKDHDWVGKEMQWQGMQGCASPQNMVVGCPTMFDSPHTEYHETVTLSAYRKRNCGVLPPWFATRHIPASPVTAFLQHTLISLPIVKQCIFNLLHHFIEKVFSDWEGASCQFVQCDTHTGGSSNCKCKWLYIFVIHNTKVKGVWNEKNFTSQQCPTLPQ